MAYLPLIKHLSQKGLIYQQIESVIGPRVQINDRWLLSFISSNYLGMNQSGSVKRAFVDSIKKWGISLGTPRVLGIDRITVCLEAQIARLVGQDKALVFPSTSQLALDVISFLTGSNGVLFLDEWSYPTSFEGAYAAQRRGVKCYRFKHNSVRAVAKALQANASVPNKVIVCDGVYVSGGQKAPLTAFIRLARKYDAAIYVDDAHGIGILGDVPIFKTMPYGFGGTGTPGYYGLRSCQRVIHVGTLSKAFGIPIAFVAGHSNLIDKLKYHADSYTHSSSPSIPEIAGAMASLRMNDLHGDYRRNLLFQRVRQFVYGLKRIGVKLTANDFFPIQTILFRTKSVAVEVAGHLRRMGLWILLQLGPPDIPQGGAIRFVITALHKRKDIKSAVDAIKKTQQRFSRHLISDAF